MDKRLISVDLKGKTVLVTGGAKGIGGAASRAFGAAGAHVAVNYNSSRNQALAMVKDLQDLGGRAIAVQADVSQAEDIERLFCEAQESLGATIDILVNNAGSQIRQCHLEEMPVELWNEVLALNVTSAMLCSQYAIGGMKQKGWGRLINISSISAHTGGGPGGGHYAASKAAMSSLTRSLAKEVGAFGITANSIDPGVILTDIHKKFNTPENLAVLSKATSLGFLGKADDVAGAALFLASDSAAYITGATIAVNGGLRMD